MRHSRRRRRAFTLVEVLVVIGIVALLVGALLPALARARRSAQSAQCLSNMRQMQAAQLAYALDNKGWLIQAGFAHGAASGNEPVAWFNTLQSYYQNKLIARCPSDESIHFDEPVPGTTPPIRRRTSYGINNFLDKDMCPWGGPYLRLTQVRSPASTVQFVEMARSGSFAAADHPHVENWDGSDPAQHAPRNASNQLEINAHGNLPKSFESVANYGFLDGHAETLRFRDVYESKRRNRFDPAIAQ
jgi:prepilin-type N-terminal cleavage/methylation domain-containing protein/prepilin-type processing-associated H-X9-DG protein